MRRFNTVLFVLVNAIAVSCNHKSSDSDTSTVSIKCYQFSNGRDSISLTMKYMGDSIKGTLSYHLFQKDKNVGMIYGKVDDDLLIADYIFQSEGTQSLRQVVFKRIGDNLIEGYGEEENRKGASYFRSIDSLKFNDFITLKLVNCRPLN
jgi:hypothetical protein